MQRILIESRSNRLFRGIEIDQNYDQRGGLCQIEQGHLAVTTNPVDAKYLEYWKTLGFTLPEFLTAGPFDPRYTLSELIMQKPAVAEAIRRYAQNAPSRLEFSYIEPSEAALAEFLNIPAYCNFDFSLRLSRKLAFKQVCEQLHLPTLPWHSEPTPAALLAAGRQLLSDGQPFVFKANDGTGGIPSGSLLKISTVAELDAAEPIVSHAPITFFIEHLLSDVAAEIALHWEMNADGKLLWMECFEQLHKAFAYSGVAYPTTLAPAIRQEIETQFTERFYPYLVQHGGQGFFCCDLLVDQQGVVYWTDFNPRKGGILYIWEVIRRLARQYLSAGMYTFWHEHEHPLPPSFQNGLTFSDIRSRLADLLDPSHPPFVLITNPGILQFGYIDLSGVSTTTLEDSRKIFEEAKQRLC